MGNRQKVTLGTPLDLDDDIDLDPGYIEVVVEVEGDLD